MPFLIILAILEILVFVLIGESIGFLWAISLIIAGSAGGIYLLRTANLKMMEKMQQKIAKGQMPLQEMMSAPFRMIAGWLLIIPGIITSIFGLLCLLPITRKFLLKAIMRSKAFAKFQKGGNPMAGSMSGIDINNFQMHMKNNMHKKNKEPANDDPKTLEGEFWEETQDKTVGEKTDRKKDSEDEGTDKPA